MGFTVRMASSVDVKPSRPFRTVAMINAARRQQITSSSSERKRVYQKNKLFKRIEADIKERDKRRIPGRSEAYIDQSRGISVNIGSADIRTSMLKQRMFLSKTYVLMQEEQQGY